MWWSGDGERREREDVREKESESERACERACDTSPRERAVGLLFSARALPSASASASASAWTSASASTFTSASCSPPSPLLSPIPNARRLVAEVACADSRGQPKIPPPRSLRPQEKHSAKPHPLTLSPPARTWGPHAGPRPDLLPSRPPSRASSTNTHAVAPSPRFSRRRRHPVARVGHTYCFPRGFLRTTPAPA